MKIVFMGTPDLSVCVLDAIVHSSHEVTAVVTREDKQKGRGRELAPTPVKVYAQEHGIPVYQPVKIKAPESVELLKTLDADIFVVAAYGQILSSEILSIPEKGCVNVHTSLLPKYRGSAPIQWAIIEGEKETGVTIMQMDEGMDTGDILFTKTVAIDQDETGGSLFDKLAKAGAELIVSALDKIEAGDVHPVKQDGELATYTKMLDKGLGNIHFTDSAVRIERLIRGLNPWPSTYTYVDGKTLKIWKAEALDEKSSAKPGTVIRTDASALYVGTGDGVLKITEVQLEGKKRMQTGDFLRGFQIAEGEPLG
ncbi:MAG: methionyl-tRNA formyltransferase [Lachnospiraceae bacterium]|nr:methionyl-tRNA formyltransferase [Lachnospiraceae bacterium]